MSLSGSNLYRARSVPVTNRMPRENVVEFNPIPT